MLRAYCDGTTPLGVGKPPIGAPAYFDSFTGGPIPCKVLGLGRDEFLGRDIVRVLLTMREPRGGYQPREVLNVPVRCVFPRSALVTRRGKYHIASYIWGQL